MTRTLVPALLLVLLLGGAAPGKSVFRVTAADGDPYEAVLLGSAANELHFATDAEQSGVALGAILRMVRQAPPAKSARGAVRLELVSGDRLEGWIVGGSEDGIRFRLVDKGAVTKLPLESIRVLRYQRAGGPRIEALDREGPHAVVSTDVLHVRSRDAILSMRAAVRRIDEKGATVLWEGKERTVPRDWLEGIVLAGDDVEPPGGLRVILTLLRGDHLVGSLAASAQGSVSVRLAMGIVIAVPVREIGRIEVRGGSADYLSEMDPSLVEETPWFVDNRWPYRRDACVAGSPLRVLGTEYAKGLGTHSRCRLTYEIGGRYRRFRALAALDDSAPAIANAVVRVLVDGQPAAEPVTLRPGEDPWEAEIDLTDAKRLTLVVEFGEACDVGDRVDWCDARLVR